MFPGMSLPPKPTAEVEVEESPIEEVEEIEEVGAVDISPDAVCYRDEHEVCGNCEYMQSTGLCVPLKMGVTPGAGCNLFKEGGNAEPI